MNVTMPLACLRAVSRTMPRKDDRQYLLGVHVVSGMCEATDGTVVIRCLSPQIESDGDYVIADTAVARILRDKGYFMLITDGVSDVAGRIELACECSDYPNISRLLERKGKPGMAQIDPDLLVRVKRALQDLGSKSGTFHLHQRGELPALVEEDLGHVVLTALVAPWRV